MEVLAPELGALLIISQHLRFTIIKKPQLSCNLISSSCKISPPLAAMPMHDVAYLCKHQVPFDICKQLFYCHIFWAQFSTVLFMITPPPLHLDSCKCTVEVGPVIFHYVSKLRVQILISRRGFHCANGWTHQPKITVQQYSSKD